MNEDLLKMLRRLGVKFYKRTAQEDTVEFFPPGEDGDVKVKPIDETPDEATGLTPSESRALLVMPK